MSNRCQTPLTKLHVLPLLSPPCQNGSKPPSSSLRSPDTLSLLVGPITAARQTHRRCSPNPSSLLARPIALLAGPIASTLSLSAMKSTHLQALTPPSTAINASVQHQRFDDYRCVLLGVSYGENIADYVARRFVEAGKLLDPVKVVAQILMYPCFIGSVPTKSEIKLANSYFYDKAMCLLAWKLFLPEEEVNLNHPTTNPLILGRGPPLKCMPPTLTVVVEHD
ncbi:hypothetical protein VitviT2T_011475 [Vitis vinifera]|uniref:Alpha/beta hydrolase fold-3 domain-containing protein n=1 Tax=Vitis vinifera TaxID=29760 RepID=A0ABY9CCB1_VITVI|nr:hypothetical protein VitviT2T_011475 [Vitis vinifera]